MGDIADILGVQKKPELTDGQQTGKIMAGAAAAPRPTKMKKPKGMSREVFDLVGPGGLSSAIETKGPSGGGFKEKRTSATKGKWIWTPFNSSARGDSQTFYHWAKADIQYADYPYAKYNIKLDSQTPVYTDSEYNSFLQARGWTRSETDNLMHLCCKYDLRWPIIVDRYTSVPPRSLEELQARYISVEQKLKMHRQNRINTKEYNEKGIDQRAERNRRALQDYMIRRSQEEEAEIAKLKSQIKSIESTLRKNKQMPAQERASAAQQARADAARAQRVKGGTGQEHRGLAAKKIPGQGGLMGSQGVYTSKDESASLDTEQLALVPGKPTLQSLRIPLPETQRNISKTLLKKMANLLRDLGVPDQPIASRAALDYLEGCRQSCVALLSLQTAIARKEKELQAINAKTQVRVMQHAPGDLERGPVGLGSSSSSGASVGAGAPGVGPGNAGTAGIGAQMSAREAPPTIPASGGAPVHTMQQPVSRAPSTSAVPPPALAGPGQAAVGAPVRPAPAPSLAPAASPRHSTAHPPASITASPAGVEDPVAQSKRSRGALDADDVSEGGTRKRVRRTGK